MPVLESLLRLKLDPEARSKFIATTEKFPFSITPYYLSLINSDDLAHDPVFMQSVPSVHELEMSAADMADPLLR